MRQFQCVPTTYVFSINEFSPTNPQLLSFIQRNDQLFMSFVMHLDDNYRLSILCF